MSVWLMAAAILAGGAEPNERSKRMEAGASTEQEARYAEGQVWEYRTAPGDEGSLVRIQKIERAPGLGLVYHLSLIGVRLGDGIPPELPHIPVSRETLDASLTRLAGGTHAFPDPAPGIAEWRAAQGGVFTIPLAEIAAIVRETVGSQKPQ
jgi:hypothetical protein